MARKQDIPQPVTDLTVHQIGVEDLRPFDGNPRIGDVTEIAKSLRKSGQYRPIVVRRDTMEILAGNHTWKAAKHLGWPTIAVTFVDGIDDEQAKRIVLADNRYADLGEYDEAALLDLLNSMSDLTGTGYDGDFLNALIEEAGEEGSTEVSPDLGHVAPGNLAERFLLPPFSILDQRSGPWQERRNRWLALGIRSEQGRGGNDGIADDPTETAKHGVLFKSLSAIVPDYYTQKQKAESALGRKLEREEFERDYLKVPEGGGLTSTGTSIFDPVLCELSYKWFSKQGAVVLDPFAGGSVRGIVAAAMGRAYTGLELRKEQVEANRTQAAEILPNLPATDVPVGTAEWIVGDSNQTLDSIDIKADLVFSCPPYADLEVYSDDPADISNMPYPDFLDTYRSIIRKTVAHLNDDRFIVWVIGEVRDKKTGHYRGFVSDTIQAFEDAGCHYYNEAILVGPVGSMAIRVGRQFNSGRKLGKLHQNVLVFVKGDPKAATAFCGEVEIPQDLDAADAEAGEMEPEETVADPKA